MKKFLIFVFLGIIPFISFGITINDVAQSSDLYPYVVEMVQDNIMSLDSNNNFNGSLIVTRADLARILSHLLDYFQGRIQPAAQVAQPTAQGTAISSDLLLKIQQIESTMEKYPTLQAYVTVEASSITSISVELNRVETQLSAMQNIFSSLSAVQSVPSASLLSKTIDRVSALENNVSSLNSRMTDLESSVSATVTNIESQLSSLSGASSFSSQIDALTKENTQLKSRISSLESSLNGVYLFQIVETVAVVGAIAYILFVK